MRYLLFVSAMCLAAPAMAQTCTKIGGGIMCDNGLSGQQIGNATMWNNGQTTYQYGNTYVTTPQYQSTLPPIGTEPSYNGYQPLQSGLLPY